MQLLQADGSSTLQQLLVSGCSTTKTGLQRCLVPSQFVCRQVSMDMLQFCLSCDSKDNRFKMVVATKQAMLCFSREMFVHKNKIKIVEGTGTSDKIFPQTLNLPVLATEINQKAVRVKTLVSDQDMEGEGKEREVISEEWARNFI